MCVCLGGWLNLYILHNSLHSVVLELLEYNVHHIESSLLSGLGCYMNKKPRANRKLLTDLALASIAIHICLLF